MAFEKGHPPYKQLAQKREQEAIVQTMGLLDMPLDEDAPTEKPSIPEEVRTSFVPVRRMSQNDVQEVYPWLLPRLTKLWPTVSEATWSSKFHAWMRMNDAMFVRTTSAVGLAMAIKDDIDSLVRIQERFLIAKEIVTYATEKLLQPIDAEMVAIYRTIKEWGRLQNAVRFDVLNCSDIAPFVLKKYMGFGLVEHNLTYLRLTRAPYGSRKQ